MSSSGKRSSEEEDVMARLSKCTPKMGWLPIYVRVSQLLVRILDAELSGADLFKTSEVWRKSSALGFGVESRGDCRAEIQRCACTGADRHREEGRECKSKVEAREAGDNLFCSSSFSFSACRDEAEQSICHPSRHFCSGVTLVVKAKLGMGGVSVPGIRMTAPYLINLAFIIARSGRHL